MIAARVPDVRVTRLAAGLALLCASLLPHLALYWRGTDSASFRVLAVGFAALGIAGTALGVWMARGDAAERVEPLRERVLRWRGAYLAGGIALCLIYGGFMRPEWVYVHAGLALAGLLYAIYALVYGETAGLSRVGIATVGVAVVFVLLARLYALSYYPAIDLSDESWVLGWALSYARTGRFFDLIQYFGVMDIGRFMILLSGWIGVFGTEFWHVRLFFFVVMLLVSGLTALAAHNLYGSGSLTALFLLSSAVLANAAKIRHDAGLALAVAASIWVYTEAVKRDWAALHLLAGFCIGAGMFAHYHAVGLGPALLIALYVPPWIASGRRPLERGMALFALGGLIAFGCVVALQILPDLDAFLKARTPRTPGSLALLLQAFVRHIQSIGVLSRYDLVLIGIALIAALWRRHVIDQTLALAVLLSHVALAVMASSAANYYVVPLTPIYGLLVAGMFSGRPALPKAAGVLAMTVGLGMTLHTPLEHLLRGDPIELPAPPAAVWVSENVASDRLIAGDNYYYLFLLDRRFVSPSSHHFMSADQRRPFASDEAIWDSIAPDVVVVDPNLSTCCVPPITNPAYLESRGYRVAAEFNGARVPILIYEKRQE
jgi:hypothetical protein